MASLEIWQNATISSTCRRYWPPYGCASVWVSVSFVSAFCLLRVCICFAPERFFFFFSSIESNRRTWVWDIFGPVASFGTRTHSLPSKLLHLFVDGTLLLDKLPFEYNALMRHCAQRAVECVNNFNKPRAYLMHIILFCIGTTERPNIKVLAEIRLKWVINTFDTIVAGGSDLSFRFLCMIEVSLKWYKMREWVLNADAGIRPLLEPSWSSSINWNEKRDNKWLRVLRMSLRGMLLMYVWGCDTMGQWGMPWITSTRYFRCGYFNFSCYRSPPIAQSNGLVVTTVAVVATLVA